MSLQAEKMTVSAGRAGANISSNVKDVMILERLCTECDDCRFPEGQGEGWVPMYELRDSMSDGTRRGSDRLLAVVTLDGQPIDESLVHELQAGADGWVILYDTESFCEHCNAGYLMPLLRGQVVVQLLGSAVSS